jgi:hypothetical protein
VHNIQAINSERHCKRTVRFKVCQEQDVVMITPEWKAFLRR